MSTAYRYARLCPLCDSERYKHKFQKNGYWVSQCLDCGHWFADLRRGSASVPEIYDGQYFQGDGVGYVDYLSEGERLLSKGRFYGKLLEKDFWPGSLLDVGTAGGFMLAGLNQCGWQGEGLEPNQRIAQYGRKQLKLDIHLSTLESFATDKQYDFIFMVDVLSHVYDLKRALQVAADATRPGGFWLIEIWDRQSWPARLWRSRWRAYQPPAAYQWFSGNSLAELVTQYGFTKVQQGRVKVPVSRRQLQQALHYQFQGSLGTVLSFPFNLIPSAWALPWTICDRMWVLFEKEPEPDVPVAQSPASMQQQLFDPDDSPQDTAWAAKLPNPPLGARYRQSTGTGLNQPSG